MVKASGLAAGKGVVIVESAEEAIATAKAMFGGQFGSAGDQVVIEEFLPGEEASFIVMADGRNILTMATSQDHKRLRDARRRVRIPAAWAPIRRHRWSRARCTNASCARSSNPPSAGLAKDGTPYTGFLYAGIMVHPDGTPNVLEYNCRFGDPETQPIMMRLRSDLVELCEAALDKRLDRVHADWDERAALGVVLAAEGYPDTVRKGDAISGLDAAAKLPGKVFHAGTRADGGTDPDAWRPRAVRRGTGQRMCPRRRRKSYSAGGCDLLAGHAMPARHRVSRRGERKVAELNQRARWSKWA